MPPRQRCSLRSTCSSRRDKSRYCRSSRLYSARPSPEAREGAALRPLQWPRIPLCQCWPFAHDSARTGKDLPEILAPLRIFIERFGRIEKMQVGTLRQRSRICTRRKEVAVAQDILAVGEHVLEEQDRSVRMRRAAGDGGTLEAPHAGGDHQPIDRCAALAQLLGLVGIGRERERNLSADHEVREQGVPLAHGYSVRRDDLAEELEALVLAQCAHHAAEPVTVFGLDGELILPAAIEESKVAVRQLA